MILPGYAGAATIEPMNDHKRSLDWVIGIELPQMRHCNALQRTPRASFISFTRVEIHNASRRMSHDYRLNAGLARVLDIRA